MYKCKYFAPHELVGPNVYKKYTNKDDIYSLFDENLLRIIDMVRDWVGHPLIINNWESGGKRKESGLRDPNTSTGAPKSAHKIGKAVDLICSNLTAEQLRWSVDVNKNKLPCKIRIEKTSGGKPCGWLHIDVNTKPDQKEQIYYFAG